MDLVCEWWQPNPGNHEDPQVAALALEIFVDCRFLSRYIIAGKKERSLSLSKNISNCFLEVFQVYVEVYLKPAVRLTLHQLDFRFYKMLICIAKKVCVCVCVYIWVLSWAKIIQSVLFLESVFVSKTYWAIKACFFFRYLLNCLTVASSTLFLHLSLQSAVSTAKLDTCSVVEDCLLKIWILVHGLNVWVCCRSMYKVLHFWCQPLF